MIIFVVNFKVKLSIKMKLPFLIGPF